jgi:hypothetical protein
MERGCNPFSKRESEISMHRRRAPWMFLIALLAPACGGRILQGDDDFSNGDSDQSTDAGSRSDAATLISPTDSSVRSSACGPATCSENDKCCIGIALGGDSNGSLEACVSSGVCDTALQLGCTSSGECSAGGVCCIAIDANGAARSSCVASCGGNGQPAVQACASDDECPSGSACFVASMGEPGENHIVQVCGGVR